MAIRHQASFVAQHVRSDARHGRSARHRDRDGRCARLTVVTAGGRDDFGRMAENPGTFGAELDRQLTVRLPVQAGTHTIWATTVLKSQAPRDDLIKPFMRTTDRRPRHHGRSVRGSHHDRRSVRHVRPWGHGVATEDPLPPDPSRASGSSEQSRGRQPHKKLPAPGRSDHARTTGVSQARGCFDADVLMDFYARGRQSGDFERGSSRRCSSSSPARSSCSASNPIPSREPRPVYRLGDLELASRLSFFLWSSLPDEPLIALAAQGKLKQPAVLEQQVRRCWPIRGRRRSSTTSPSSGCTCATEELNPISAPSRTSTTTSGRR